MPHKNTLTLCKLDSKHKLLFISMLCLLITGCRKLVQSEFEEHAKILVLNSILIPQQNLEVHLSYVGKVNADTIEVVQNAQVRLFVNGTYQELLQYAGEGIYQSGIVAEEESTYRYEVEVPGYDKTLIGESFIPKAEKIIQVTHLEQAGINSEGVIYPALKFSFTNTPSRQQHYEVVIKLLARKDDIRLATLERIVDPAILREGLPIALVSNSTMGENVYEMFLNYETGGTSSSGKEPPRMKLYPLVVELRTVSPDYYKFARQLYLYTQGRYPDGLISSNQSFQIYSNVENGYGIVAGYSVVQSDTIRPKTAWQYGN